MTYGMMDRRLVTVLCAACLAIGFWSGRKTIACKTEIRYVQGDTVRDTVVSPVPVIEIVHDTLHLVERDTIQTLTDWNTERYYTEQLFNNNSGLLDVSATIQYNRLQDFSYTFIPTYKETVRYKIPVWQPYAGASYNSLNQASLVTGMFYRKNAIEIQYISDFERKKHAWGIGYKYKF